MAAGAAIGGPVLAAPGTPAALAGDARPQPGNAAVGQDGFAAAATGARTMPDALAPDAEPADGIPQAASDPPADDGPLQPAGPGGDAGRPAAAGTQPVAAPPAAGAVTAIDARPAQAGAGAASATRDAEPPADAAAEPVAGTTAQPAEPGSQQADALASVQDLPQLAATPPAERAAVARTAAPVLAVSAPVGSQEWGPAVGQQMVRMSAGGHQVAELNLNPAGLGPLKVTLTMGDSQAQAMFVSAHESVRKAVEAALPQLRATLAEQGISLGQASVGADTRQPSQQGGFAERQPERAPGQPAYPRADGSSPGAAEPAARSEPLRRGPGGLDTFA
jgi:flagellar hook-length control protein FliK